MLRCIKNTVLGTLPLWNCKDPDPDQIEKPDPYQSDKQGPDPYQKGLDPQHWSQDRGVYITHNIGKSPHPPGEILAGIIKGGNMKSVQRKKEEEERQKTKGKS
jgi:hypothetical protein